MEGTWLLHLLGVLCVCWEDEETLINFNYMTLRTHLLCFSVFPSFIRFLLPASAPSCTSFSEKASHLPQCLLSPNKKVNLIFPLLEIHVSMSSFTQQSSGFRIKTAAQGTDFEAVFLRTHPHFEDEEGKFKWISQSRARTHKLYSNSTPTVNVGLFIPVFLKFAFFPSFGFILIFLHHYYYYYQHCNWYQFEVRLGQEYPVNLVNNANALSTK